MNDHVRRLHVPRSWAVALLATALAAALVGTNALAQDGAASPGPSAPVLPGEPNPPWDDGATAAAVDPNLENARPRRWEHVLVGADGRTLTVYFQNGPPECYGLADVQVTQGEGEVGIEIWTGEVPGADACPEIVQLYRTVVVLDERLVTGGSLLDLPGGRIPGA
jgi:hypothetical protein